MSDKYDEEVERLTQRWNDQFTRNSELIVEHDSLRAEIAALKAEIADLRMVLRVANETNKFFQEQFDEIMKCEALTKLAEKPN